MKIAILGSTGSIGQSALSVVREHQDRLEVVALAAGHNVARMTEQAREHRPSLVTMATGADAAHVRDALGGACVGTEVGPPGGDGLYAAATHPDVELVLCATSGTAGLDAVLGAIEAGKTVALANKEVLVMAGGLMMRAAERHDATLIPVDSEHNAIHQCLHGRDLAEVGRLILTASGGPFREWPAERLHTVTPAEALDHPTWNMGQKITIDSATLMNKGLEVIEARWLFDMPAEKIEVIVHPQSVVHSLVALCDGSVIAQMGVTDMRLPIQYAFSYPERWDTALPALDLTARGRLDFEPPDLERFPCLSLAYQALTGRSELPVVLNAANEVAVHAFLRERVAFRAIPQLISEAMEAAEARRIGSADTLASIREVDAWTREFSTEAVRRVESSRRH